MKQTPVPLFFYLIGPVCLHGLLLLQVAAVVPQQLTTQPARLLICRKGAEQGEDEKESSAHLVSCLRYVCLFYTLEMIC